MTATRAEEICNLIIHNWKPEGDDERLKAIEAVIAKAVDEAIVKTSREQNAINDANYVIWIKTTKEAIAQATSEATLRERGRCLAFAQDIVDKKIKEEGPDLESWISDYEAGEYFTAKEIAAAIRKQDSASIRDRK